MPKCARCSAHKKRCSFNKSSAAVSGLSSWCRKCSNEYNRIRYQQNREQQIERTKKWRRDNLQKSKEYDRRYAELNPEKRKQWAKKSRSKNADKIRLRDAVRKEKRKEAALKTKHPITPYEWALIKEMQSERCFYCLSVPKTLEMDHYLPIKHGGDHSAENIVGACKSCNCKKQARHPEVWINILREKNRGKRRN